MADRQEKSEQSDTLPWTREEAGDFQAACQLTSQIMELNAQRIAIWKRFCQSRDARRESAQESCS